ncbi:MAG: putative DNA binding domain-containing protein [Gammaproteobacteria bacterium]|nr:putative DNA binding domain-containing protein [Gammaproteobacteria bacterium]
MNREKLVKDLIYQIRLGEDSRFEYKDVHMQGNVIKGPSQKDLADEMAAFANTKGGSLTLGVNDKTRDITGIAQEHIEQVQQLVTRASQDNIEPPLQPFVQLVELPNRDGELRIVIHIQIDRSLFVHKSNGRYYHRVNESKKEMAPDFLHRLMMQRSQARLIRFEEQAVMGAAIGDLDASLTEKLTLSNNQPVGLQLRKLKIIVKGEDGNEHPSVAGVLMATRDPRLWLPNAYIQCVAYRGETRDANDQIDAQDITGPLDQQVLQALAFVERNMKTAAKKNVGREDLPQYSIKALFEALVNAVAHRDYAIYGAKIRLHMFNDRLELASPGALANTMEVDDLEMRQSCRNELLASLLARCTVQHAGLARALMMDKRGEGVPIILNESETLSGQRPDYQMAGEELMLTIYAANPKTDDR